MFQLKEMFVEGDSVVMTSQNDQSKEQVIVFTK